MYRDNRIDGVFAPVQGVGLWAELLGQVVTTGAQIGAQQLAPKQKKPVQVVQQSAPSGMGSTQIALIIGGAALVAGIIYAISKRRR